MRWLESKLKTLRHADITRAKQGKKGGIKREKREYKGVKRKEENRQNCGTKRMEKEGVGLQLGSTFNVFFFMETALPNG